MQILKYSSPKGEGEDPWLIYNVISHETLRAGVKWNFEFDLFKALDTTGPVVKTVF